jgi:small GTP-binding protein
MRWSTGIYQRNHPSTIGANHHRKRFLLSGEEVEVFVWDTAGQEQFHSLTPLYSRSAAVALLVTSVDKDTSFEHIDHWISLLEQSASTLPPIVLAVNKMDLLADSAAKQEEIETKYGTRFSGIFFVSALTNENVNNLFMAAAAAGYAFFKTGNGAQVTETLPEQTQKTSHCCA